MPYDATQKRPMKLPGCYAKLGKQKLLEGYVFLFIWGGSRSAVSGGPQE
jgi:hypothetical protein